MIIAAVAMLTACGSGQTGQVDPEQDTTATARVEKPALPLPEPGVMQTMGKVVAERYADLAFKAALPIEQVLVRNGQKVRRGQVLATLGRRTGAAPDRTGSPADAGCDHRPWLRSR